MLTFNGGLFQTSTQLFKFGEIGLIADYCNLSNSAILFKRECQKTVNLIRLIC